MTKIIRDDSERGKRFYLFLCEAALEPLHLIKKNMYYIEVDRAKRSRTDPIGIKAYETKKEIEKVETKVNELLGLIQKEK
jgi:hypothetical protein